LAAICCAEVLSRFESDLAFLAATELHPSLRPALGGSATLLSLLDAPTLREAAAACQRAHQHFGGKVAELDGLFQLLQADIEALFMQVGRSGVWV
jgi:hypothetical protein